MIIRSVKRAPAVLARVKNDSTQSANVRFGSKAAARMLKFCEATILDGLNGS